jgi:hypothetical protein
MVDREDDDAKCRLFNHWQEFFDMRDRHQNELMRVETSKAQQAHLSREQNPSIKNTTMYYWQRIKLSGGKEIYKRIRINKSNNQSEFECYHPPEHKYNAFANEWDLFEEFAGKPTIGTGFTDELDDDDHWESPPEPVLVHEEVSKGDDDHWESPPEPVLVHEEVSDDDDDPCETPEEVSYLTDVIETATLVYSYVPMLGVPSAPAKHNWEWVLKTLGFSRDLAPGVISTNDKNAIACFLDCVIEGTLIPQDLDGFNPHNHAVLQELYDFGRIERISKDLFLFHSPTLSACTWSLGVTQQVALYVI